MTGGGVSEDTNVIRDCLRAMNNHRSYQAASILCLSMLAHIATKPIVSQLEAYRVVRVIPRCTVQVSSETVGKVASWWDRALRNPGNTIHPSDYLLEIRFMFLRLEQTD